MTGQATAKEALALARLLADEADAITLALYRRRHELTAAMKVDLTEVTDADRTVEDRLARNEGPQATSRPAGCWTRSTPPATFCGDLTGGRPCSPWRSTARSRSP